MSSDDLWKNLAGKEVCIHAGYEETCRMGRLLGSGGAGAVYDFCQWGNDHWVIKVLNPDSEVAKQERRSCRRFHAAARFPSKSAGLMKFNTMDGTLTCDGQSFDCYFMRRGKTLSEAIQTGEEWLKDPEQILRLIGYLINAIADLKDMGLGHGDIKPSNILLVEHHGTFFPMFSDYGTISDKKSPVESVSYEPTKFEYAGKQEELIAYDLHCLCEVIYEIFATVYGRYQLRGMPSQAGDRQIAQVLRIMRDNRKRAGARLLDLINYLADKVDVIPVSFYLDVVPRFEITEEFPFDTVLEWGDHLILRDRNVRPGEAFDPLLLMKIPKKRYDEVYKILTQKNDLVHFVLPICRYYDRKGNEYVLIHAPDDWNKRSHRRGSRPAEWRIQDDSGVPHTLEKAASPVEAQQVLAEFLLLLSRLEVNARIALKDLWYLDGRWKLNLFSVNIPCQIEKKTPAAVYRGKEVPPLDPKEKRSKRRSAMNGNAKFENPSDGELKNFTGWEWSRLLAGRPEFAGKCDKWDEFHGGEWAYLLKHQPQFADLCRWEKLFPHHWRLLLSYQPQFAEKCGKWDRFTPQDWAFLLARQPQFAEKCRRWDEFEGSHWMWLLSHQEQFADLCRWDKLDGEDWRLLLESKPEFAEIRRKLPASK